MIIEYYDIIYIEIHEALGPRFWSERFLRCANEIKAWTEHKPEPKKDQTTTPHA